MHPVGDDEGIALGLGVAEAVGLVILAGLLPVVGVGVVGDLKVVLAVLGVDAELVTGGLVADDGDEGALGVGGVVEDLRDGRGQAVVGA